MLLKNSMKMLWKKSLFASMVLMGIIRVLTAYGYTCPAGSSKKIGGICFADNTGLAETDPTLILTNLLGWITFMFGSVAMVILIFCGFQYLFSAGDDTQAENAKRCMKWAIIGIVVAGLAFAITRTIAFLSYGLPPVI